RIVGSGPLGFRCIVGCSGSSGSALNQLQGPRSLAFDTDGNLYVSDRENDRIMTYTLFNSSCVYTTTTSTSTSSTSTSTTSTSSTSTSTTSTPTTSTSTSTKTTSTSTSTTSTTSTSTSSTSTSTKTTSTSTTAYSVSNVSNCSFTKYSSYLVSNVKSDFTSAQICCESMNMTLIEIESANEQARVLNITTLIQAPFFIGLNQTCGTNNYSTWLSGKPVLFSNFGMFQIRMLSD
ncbi:unnamed protein product, partial [Adineta ricciae]